MADNDKIYDLIEKMYNEMKIRFDKVEKDINNLNGGQQEIKALVTELD